MGQLCTCTRSQAVRVNKERSPAPRVRPSELTSLKSFNEQQQQQQQHINDNLLHLHHPAYRQQVENHDRLNHEVKENGSLDVVLIELSPSTAEDDQLLQKTRDSGIFSKTSSSSSADERPVTATKSSGLSPRLTNGGTSLPAGSVVELGSASHDSMGLPDKIDFVRANLSNLAPTSHDMTASTFSMASVGSLAYDADVADRIARLRQIYEAKIRRVLLQSVDLLAEELSPASLAEYLRRTRPQQAGATDGELLAELFGGPEGISPDMEVAASILKDLLWDVVTCRGLENFEDFCSSLMENDQTLLACMIDSIDKLLAVVSPDPRFMDPQFLSDQIQGSVCCECCRNIEEDNRMDSADCFDTSRDFNIEVIGWEVEGGTKDKSKSLTHSPLTRRHKGYDSLSYSMGHSSTDLALMSSSLPLLSVRLYRYCLCAGERLERLEGVLRGQGGGCVRELSLVDCHLACKVANDGGKSWLTTAICNNQSLVKLDLRLSSLGPTGWQDLGEGLTSNTALRLLNLASSGLTDTSCLQILSSLSRHTSLSDLDLGFNDIRDAGCKVIAGSSLVRRGGTLRRLRLRDNGITSEGSAALASALIGNSRLALLDISSNSVGNDGTARLSDALISNRSLRDLDLENCGVGEAGCVTLARALRANAALRRLQLSLNPLEDLGAKALAGGLKYNRGLESLSLNMCAIGNAGFDSLLEALYASNGTIRLVKLCYNDIGGTKGGLAEWESRQPPLEVLYRKMRELLHRNEDMKMILWGNDLEDLPAFTAYMAPVEGAGLSDAVSLTFSDNTTTSAEASPAVSGPRGGQVWRRGGPLVPCRT